MLAANDAFVKARTEIMCRPLPQYSVEELFIIPEDLLTGICVFNRLEWEDLEVDDLLLNLVAHRQILIDSRNTKTAKQHPTDTDIALTAESLYTTATVQATDISLSSSCSTNLDWSECLETVASSTQFLASCVKQLTTAYWIAFGRPPPAPNWLLLSQFDPSTRPTPAPNWKASSFMSIISNHLDYGGVNFAKSSFCIRPNIHSILHPIYSVTSVISAEEAYWAIVWLISFMNGYGLVQCHKIELFLGKRFLPNIFGAFPLDLCIDYLALFYTTVLRLQSSFAIWISGSSFFSSPIL